MMKVRRNEFILLGWILLILIVGIFFFYYWIENSSNSFYQHQTQILNYTVKKDTKKLSSSQIIRLTSQTKPVFLDGSPKIGRNQVENWIKKISNMTGSVDHLAILKLQSKVYYDTKGRAVTTWWVQGLNDQSEFDFEIEPDTQMMLNFNWVSEKLTGKSDLTRIGQGFSEQLGVKLQSKEIYNDDYFKMKYLHHITYEVKRTQSHIVINNISNMG